MNDYVTAVLAFPGAFSARECLAIRELPLAVSPEVGMYPQSLAGLRKAESCVVPANADNAWIRERLAEYARKANEYFNVLLTGEMRPVLRVRYDVGDFFGWHSDLGDEEESTRKLSLILHLSPPADFAGGQLQFVGTDGPMPAPEAGTVFVFPSHFAHEVMTVTRGSREALVSWIHGPPFR